MTILDPIMALLQSRKFWLLVIGVVIALIMLVGSDIIPDQFAGAVA